MFLIEIVPLCASALFAIGHFLKYNFLWNLLAALTNGETLSDETEGLMVIDGRHAFVRSGR